MSLSLTTPLWREGGEGERECAGCEHEPDWKDGLVRMSERPSHSQPADRTDPSPHLPTPSSVPSSLPACFYHGLPLIQTPPQGMTADRTSRKFRSPAHAASGPLLVPPALLCLIVCLIASAMADVRLLFESFHAADSAPSILAAHAALLRAFPSASAAPSSTAPSPAAPSSAAPSSSSAPSASAAPSSAFAPSASAAPSASSAPADYAALHAWLAPQLAYRQQAYLALILAKWTRAAPLRRAAAAAAAAATTCKERRTPAENNSAVKSSRREELHSEELRPLKGLRR